MKKKAKKDLSSTSSSPQRFKRRLYGLIRGIIAAAFLGGLIFSGKLDFHLFPRLLSPGSLPWFGVGVSVFVISQIAAGYRIYLLLASQKLSYPFVVCLKSIWVGLAFNHFLPASIGGDAAKIYAFYGSRKERLSSITATVAFDRAMGLLGLCFLALGGVAISSLNVFNATQGIERGWLYKSLAVLVVAIMVAVTSLIGLSRLKFVNKIPESRRFFRIVKSILLDLVVFSRRLWLAGYCCLISVCIHLLSAFGIYSFSRALVGEAELLKTMILGPLVFLANVIPVSLGNIGWSEYVGYMVWSDQGMEYGSQIWLVQRLIAILVSLPGLLFFLQHKNHEGQS